MSALRGLKQATLLNILAHVSAPMSLLFGCVCDVRRETQVISVHYCSDFICTVLLGHNFVALVGARILPKHAAYEISIQKMRQLSWCLPFTECPKCGVFVAFSFYPITYVFSQLSEVSSTSIFLVVNMIINFFFFEGYAFGLENTWDEFRETNSGLSVKCR